MTPPTDRRWPLAILFITPALWSVNYLVSRSAPGIIAPHMLALLRWSLAVVILAAFAWPELWAKRHLLLTNAWHYFVVWRAWHLDLWRVGLHRCALYRCDQHRVDLRAGPGFYRAAVDGLASRAAGAACSGWALRWRLLAWCNRLS